MKIKNILCDKDFIFLMNYRGNNPNSTSQMMGELIFTNVMSSHKYDEIYKNKPSLPRSNSDSSDNEKIYYNADFNVSHRSVPHNPYSICKEYTNCSMTSPICDEDDCD